MVVYRSVRHSAICGACSLKNRPNGENIDETFSIMELTLSDTLFEQLSKNIKTINLFVQSIIPETLPGIFTKLKFVTNQLGQ